MTNDSSPPEPPAGKRHPGMTRAEFEARVKVRRDQFDQANEKITARTGRNLINAIAIGLGLGLVMLFSLIVVKEIFVVLETVLIAFTALELATALRHAGRDVPRIPTVAVAVIVGPIAYFFPEWYWAAMLGGILVVTLWRLVELIFPKNRASAKDVLLDLTVGVFVQVYLTFLGSIALLLLAQDGGQWWVLAFIVVVVCTDVGAYASGLNFGRHPMAPTISPKKTWEGFAGSWIAALVASIVLSIFMLGMPWWFGFIFGTVLVLTGTMGDLSESLLKRDLGIKDMSTWLPGHGGFLDRLDSILPSAVAAYVLYLVFT
jgi:phosphatidate cytidylyltransferase